MQIYENWSKKNKQEKKNRFTGVLVLLGFIIPCSLILYLHVSGKGRPEAEELGAFFYILFFLLCLGEYFMIRNWRKQPSGTIEQYKIYKQKALEEKALEEKIKKERNEWGEKRRNEVLIEIKKSLETEFTELDLLEKNIQALKELKFSTPFHLKSTIRELETEISEKCGVDALQNFLRIEKFIEDVKYKLNFYNAGIIKSVDIPFYKETLITDKMNNGQEHTGSDAEVMYKTLIKLSKGLIPTRKNEIQQLYYLDAIASSMVVFALNGKNVLYLEILEAFDKLGALNSTWQKLMEDKMTAIHTSVKMLSDLWGFPSSGFIKLNSNFEKLVDQNDVIIGTIKELDESVKMGNTLEALTAYQVYKVNKKT